MQIFKYPDPCLINPTRRMPRPHRASVAAATAYNDELTLNVPNILLVAYARLRLGSADICPRRRGEGKNGSNESAPGLGAGGEVRARIALGALSGGLYRDTLRAGDAFDLVAEIEADPAHVGESAQIHLLIRDPSGRVAQLGADGEVATWDETLEGLVPLRELGSLAAVERFRIVSGLSVDADMAGPAFELFLAYQAGGELVYPAQPLRLRVAE